MHKETLTVGKSAGICRESRTWEMHHYLSGWLARIQRWRRNARTRRQLSDLPANLLRDIGLSDQQVRHEVQKKFWQ